MLPQLAVALKEGRDAVCREPFLRRVDGAEILRGQCHVRGVGVHCVGARSYPRTHQVHSVRLNVAQEYIRIIAPLYSFLYRINFRIFHWIDLFTICLFTELLPRLCVNHEGHVEVEATKRGLSSDYMYAVHSLQINQSSKRITEEFGLMMPSYSPESAAQIQGRA